MPNDNQDVIVGQQGEAGAGGPFLARVISHLDPSYMGTLEVEILRPVGNSGTDGQLHQVKMMSPFYGQTSVDHVGQDPNDYNNTQKSYGMWFVPPDVGTTVIIIFIDGDPKRGYWIGCVPDEATNFMVPGIAATEAVVEGGGRLPVAEYNKKANEQVSDPTKVKKPKHIEQALFLEKQGLLKDDIRGITTSSARREVPSSVFGISTPGPVDKRNNAKRGKIGKQEAQIPNAFVSRLGGTTFVMDDGDDKFLRKTPAGGAKAGPPEYVAVEQGETGGDPTIPHNELFRIRTRTGHQILLHNSEDLIYIGNASGTTWIEMTSNGKIDIFADDSISIHTKYDLNIKADRDINMQATGDINLSGKNVNVQSTDNTNLKSKSNKITSTVDTHIYSGGNTWNRAGTFYTNPGSTGAQGTATQATDALVPARVPQHEPWKGHENLDPTAVTPAKTKAKTTTAAEATPAYYQKYTTKTDTFSKVKGS